MKNEKEFLQDITAVFMKHGIDDFFLVFRHGREDLKTLHNCISIPMLRVHHAATECIRSFSLHTSSKTYDSGKDEVKNDNLPTDN